MDEEMIKKLSALSAVFTPAVVKEVKWDKEKI